LRTGRPSAFGPGGQGADERPVAVAKHLVSALAHGGIAPPETGDVRPLDAG